MKIKYCYKMLEQPSDKNDTNLIEIPIKEIPKDILEIINNHKAFAEPSSFGKKGIGDPEEYEKLVITEGDNKKQFEYFNKGLHFMMSGTEEERPVFQVFAQLMKILKKHV